MAAHEKKMAEEEIIKQILLKHPELERDQLLERLRNEKNKSGGLIADTTLLRLIAAEYGIKIAQNRIYEQKFSINHVFPGLNDVTVTGRIVAVYPSRTFEGKRPGKFASVVISDKDGILRVMLWNDKAELVELSQLKTGQIVRFSHGYTREDRDGKAELHLGDKSKVEINPPDISAEDLPIIGKFGTKIRDITGTQKTVHLAGFVKKIFPPSTFVRQDQTGGTVMRMILADDTGEIPVVIWNEKTDEAEQRLKENVGVQIVNARVKATSNHEIEVHVDTSTYISISSINEQSTKIASLSESMKSVNVEGEVSTEPESREVKTAKGETVKLTVFNLKDETGTVKVLAWRNHAEIASNLKLSDRVLLKNVYAKEGFENGLELSTRTWTSITVLH